MSRHQYQPSSLDTKFENGEHVWIVPKSPAQKLYSKKKYNIRKVAQQKEPDHAL